ncbi:uncharacterized protein M6D78_003588 isoform 4-T4 [Vipera latastei]
MNMALSQSNKLKQRSPGWTGSITSATLGFTRMPHIHSSSTFSPTNSETLKMRMLGYRNGSMKNLLTVKSGRRNMSFKPLEKKTRALQEELEEIQEVLQEYQNQSRQRQLHIHKQEKENQKMAEIVKELEKKVFKQQLDEQYNKDVLKELRSEGSELKRHLFEWEAKWQTKYERIRQFAERCTVWRNGDLITGLSLGGTKETSTSGTIQNYFQGILLVCIFPTSNSPGCLEAAVGLGQTPVSGPAVSSASPFLSWQVLQAAMLAAALNTPALHPIQEVVSPFSFLKALTHVSLMTFNKIE